MNAPAAELTVFRAKDFASVRVVGRANFASSPGFQSAVEELIADHPSRLVLDLEQCQLMDSTFLGVLAGGAVKFHQSAPAPANIELSNANTRVTGLIQSLGVGNLFTERTGPLELPPDVRAKRVAAQSATKIQLKETSLAAHEQLMQISEANKEKFAELTRTLKDDLARLKAGEPPTLPGFDMAAINQQVGEVGGDFYDFAPRAGLRAAVLIADVCGKGTTAAEISTQARPILRELLATERAPAAIFAEALPRVAAIIPKGRFVTALCVVLDSVSRSFRVARAGHDPLLWFHAATQTVEILSPKGMALGIEREGLCDATFLEKEHQLAPGDVLLLHTDGITENFNPSGDEFGCERLMGLLVDLAPLDAKGIAAKILAAVDAFTQDAPQLDDRTLVVIKAL